MTDVDLRLGRWQDVLADVECDALIVDAPYSERTHTKHNNGAGSANRFDGGPWMRPTGTRDTGRPRRQIAYGDWSSEDVSTFVASWAPRVRGWIVTITDHVLAPVWADEFEAAGRYVFAPLPFVETGSRVRLSGDGPSCWTCWVIVARPKLREFQRWGTLPGSYVTTGPGGQGTERKPVVGGKPLGLMRAIVRDYTRPGDLVCDPCAGGGTTLLAARMEGRRAVGAEMMPEHYEIARRRLAALPIGTDRQPALFDGVER